MNITHIKKEIDSTFLVNGCVEEECDITLASPGLFLVRQNCRLARWNEHMRIYQSFRETNHVTDRLTNLSGNGRDDPFDNKNTQPRDILGTIQMDQAGLYVMNYR